jgi:hypothetical protein
MGRFEWELPEKQAAPLIKRLSGYINTYQVDKRDM